MHQVGSCRLHALDECLVGLHTIHVNGDSVGCDKLPNWRVLLNHHGLLLQRETIETYLFIVVEVGRTERGFHYWRELFLVDQRKLGVLI